MRRGRGIRSGGIGTLCILGAALGVAGAADAQKVTEGVHSRAKGPSNLCGISGANALELIGKLQSAPNVRRDRDAGRFQVYESTAQTVQWLISKRHDPAYPSVTCRRVYEDSNGKLQIDRAMRCDARRSVCDALFVQLQASDKELQATIAEHRKFGS